MPYRDSRESGISAMTFKLPLRRLLLKSLNNTIGDDMFVKKKKIRGLENNKYIEVDVCVSNKLAPTNSRLNIDRNTYSKLGNNEILQCTMSSYHE